MTKKHPPFSIIIYISVCTVSISFDIIFIYKVNLFFFSKSSVFNYSIFVTMLTRNGREKVRIDEMPHKSNVCVQGIERRLVRHGFFNIFFTVQFLSMMVGLRKYTISYVINWLFHNVKIVLVDHYCFVFFYEKSQGFTYVMCVISATTFVGVYGDVDLSKPRNQLVRLD